MNLKEVAAYTLLPVLVVLVLLWYIVVPMYFDGRLAWLGGPTIPVSCGECLDIRDVRDGSCAKRLAACHVTQTVAAATYTLPAWWPWKSPVSTATP